LKYSGRWKFMSFLGHDTVQRCCRIATFRGEHAASIFTHYILNRLRQRGSPKRRYSTTSLRGVTAQKTSTWIFITVRTSNLSSGLCAAIFYRLTESLPKNVMSKSFRTKSTRKYRLTINTRWEATKIIMAVKLTRLTHKMTIQLQLVAENCTICSSRARWPVRKLLDIPSYVFVTSYLDTHSDNFTFRLSTNVSTIQSVQRLGYGPDDRGSIPGHRLQTDSRYHPESYQIDTNDSSPWGKAAGAWIWPLPSFQCWG
jgi:hypothetical protein